MSARHRSRPRWGQNFLVDVGVARRIVDLAHVDGARVLEIGPGRGALTEMLAERAAELSLVEIDPELAAHWQERFADDPKVTVVGGDAMTVDLDPLLAEPTVVVSNLPYESGTAIVQRLLEHPGAVARMVVMLQLEVCRRLRARPGEDGYGVLSVMTAIAADVDAGFRVSPGSFRPAPKVFSEVVRVTPLDGWRHDTGDRETFRAVVKRSFGARRKMLRNTLGAWLSERLGDAETRAVFEQSDVDWTLRPERIPVERFAALSRAVHAREALASSGDA